MEIGHEHGELCGATAHNNRKEDARLLYIMVLASSRFAVFFELRAFMASKRDGLLCGGRYAQRKPSERMIMRIIRPNIRGRCLMFFLIVPSLLMAGCGPSKLAISVHEFDEGLSSHLDTVIVWTHFDCCNGDAI